MISHNRHGVSTLHYNRYLGHDSQVYLRKANESIEIFDSEISSNAEEAFHVFTPFRELNQFNISDITYMINRTKFLDNGGGIFQYSKVKAEIVQIDFTLKQFDYFSLLFTGPSRFQ